jgi:hypothetical protein
VTIPEIAERLQQDLVESHREKLKKLRNGTQLKFVQKALGDWGYELSAKKIHDLAAQGEVVRRFYMDGDEIKVR